MNLEQAIKHLVDEHLSNTKSNEPNNNQNNNNNYNINNNNNNNEKKESYKLVEKCLQEACKIYKIACFIELFIFLILISIFVYFNLAEINAEEFWQINSSLEKILLKNSPDHIDLEIFSEINLNIISLFDDETFNSNNQILYNKIKYRHQRVTENCSPSVLNTINITKACYPAYSLENEEKSKNFTGIYWVYENATISRIIHEDEINTYDNGGYIFSYIHKDQAEKFNFSQINQRTRLLSIELLIFNKDLKTLTDFKIIIKKSPTSNYKMLSKAFTLKITKSINVKIILAFTVVFLIYYGYEKLVEIYKGDFFKSHRLIGDILDLMIFWFAIHTLICSVRLIKFFNASILLNNQSVKFDLIRMIELNDENHYDLICIYVDEYYYFVFNFSMFTVVSFTRLLKHSIIYRPFEIIIRSLRTICYNILQFSPFVFLVFIAFAMFGVRVFGSIMNEYQTVEMAVITLVSVLLGDLKYEKYYEYNEFIGTFYFCSYAIVIAIICFNIISAIINESYESVKSYLNDESQRYHITPDNEYVQRNFNFIIKLKLNHYETEMRVVLEAMVMLSSSNRILTKLEIDSDLNKLEYDNESLESMLIKYGLETIHSELNWKKNQMDHFRNEIAKERQELDDLFAISLKLNQEEFKKREELELSKQIFVHREKYFNLEQKIFRLRNILKIVDVKAKTIINNIKLLKKKI